MSHVKSVISVDIPKYIVGLAIACAMLAGIIFYLSREPVPPAAVPLSEVGTGGKESRSAAERVPNRFNEDKESVVVERAVPIAPLPDSSLELSEQLPALLQRADSGDPVASCRLIVSINRCREERRNRVFTDAMVRSLGVKSGKNDDLIVGLVASSQESQAKKGSYCAGVETRSLPQPEELYNRAMNRFTPRQKTVLAMMRSDGSIRRVNGRGSYSESGLYIMPQFLADNTLDFLMTGYAAKDPLALEGLVMLHSPGNALTRGGVSVWLPNPKLFLLYSTLLRDLFGPESMGRTGLLLMQVTESTMTPDQLDDIRRRAAAEASQWRQFAMSQSKGVSPDLTAAPEEAFKACTE